MLDDILSDVMEECEDDHVGLWSVHWRIERAYPHKSPEERRSLTLEVVRKLLEKGMVVGQFSKLGTPVCEPHKRIVRVHPEYQFHLWDMPLEAVERIDREWRELGRDPTLGDIA